MTVGEFLEKWLETCRERQIPRPLAPATIENYEICVTHFVGEFDARPVDKLAPGEVQEVYNRWLKDAWHPRTVEQIHEVIHVAFNWGVKNRWLAVNVLDSVEPPHPRRRRQTVLSPDELDKLLEVARSSPLYPLIFTAAYTGLRRGELLGLRWQNFDLDEGTLEVTEIFQRIKRTNIVKDPKSEVGIRTVPLYDEAVAVLRDLRQRNPHDLVFCKPDGSHYSPSYVTHRFSEIAKKAGFKMRLHDERHTFVTLVLAAGGDLKTAQALVGHEDYQTTADDYAQVLQTVMRRAVQGMGKSVENSRHQLGINSENAENPEGKS